MVMTKARGSSFDAKRYGAISAADYGVTGDGTTDDGAAVLAALTALRDTDGIVELYFPPGTIRLQTPVSIDMSTAPKPMRLLGCSGAPQFTVEGDEAVGITLTDFRGGEIEGLSFLGDDDTGGTAAAFGLALLEDSVGAFPRRVTVRDCLFEHFKRASAVNLDGSGGRGGAGMFIADGTHVMVERCEFLDNNQALWAWQTADLTIRECRVDDTYKFGFDIRPGGIVRVHDCTFSGIGTLGTVFEESVNAVTTPYAGILLEDADQRGVIITGCGFTDSVCGIAGVDGSRITIRDCTFAPRNTSNDGDFTVFLRRFEQVTIDDNFWTCPASGSANYDLVSVGSTSTKTAYSVRFRGNQVNPSGTVVHVLELDPGSGGTVALGFEGNTVGDDLSASDWSITDVVQLVQGTINGAITDNTIIAGSGTSGCDITRVLETSGGTVGTLFAARNTEEEVGSGAITNKINDQVAEDYTASNVTTDRSFDADTVAVAELADIVGTLVADLAAIGVVR